MLRRLTKISLVILTLALALGRAGEAQSTTGTITGTVTDQAHAVVVGAQLTLTNTLTGLVKTSSTNRTGQYVLDFIPVGHYSLRVSDTGFNTEERDNIDIAADQDIQFNFTLHVLSTQQSIIVTNETPLVSVGTSDQLSDVTTTQLNELPVAHQDWTTLLQTAPGVAQTNNGSAGSEAGSGIVINGLPATGYNLTVDGTNATQDVEHPAFGFSGEPNIINTINNDAIQEVSMVRGIAPASVSGTMAGNINIITKGGTNHFHGDAYEINEENLYDARNQFLTDRPRTTFNQFGAALDQGYTWSDPITVFPQPGLYTRQPVVVFQNQWLFPVYHSAGGSITSNAQKDHSYVEVSADAGKSWKECDVPNSGGYVQMNIIPISSNHLIAFFRSRYADWIYQSESTDGCAWTPPHATLLPNNNASIQATRLADGHLLMIFNNTQAELKPEHADTASRRILSVALSEDDGKTWPWIRDLESPSLSQPILPLEDAEYSYPSIIQSADGMIQAAFTFRRETIKWMTFSEDWIKHGTTSGGKPEDARHEGVASLHPAAEGTANPFLLTQAKHTYQLADGF